MSAVCLTSITFLYILDTWNHLYSQGSRRGKHSPHTQHHQRAIQCRRGSNSGAVEIYEVSFHSVLVLEILGEITEECIARCPTFRHMHENQIKCFAVQIMFLDLAICDDWLFTILF